MQRSFRPLPRAPIGLASMSQSRTRRDVAQPCEGWQRVLAFAATVNGLYACQHAPFTSCLDDSTPCEVSDIADGTESSASTSTEGSIESSHTNTTLGQSANSASTSPNNSLASSNSAGLEEDARVAIEPEGDASIGPNAGDSAINSTLTDPPQLTNDDNSVVASPLDAGVTSEPSIGSSTDETSTAAVPTGDSLITNGDFSSGMTNWKIEQTGGRGPLMTDEDGILCVQSQGNVDFTIGWPADAAEAPTCREGATSCRLERRGSASKWT